MMLYRILTENTNRDAVEAIVNKYFTGFTILNGIGYWNNVQELCLVIEIVDNNDIAPSILRLAEQIKLANNQQSVLVQEIQCNVTFV